MSNKTEEFFRTPVKMSDSGKEFFLDESSLRFCEAAELRRLVTESDAAKSLEIGLALGASAVAIAEALDSKPDADRMHLVLDPFQHDFGDVGLHEISRLGLQHRVEFMPIFAEQFLSECARSGRCFDFIFSDGGHSIGSKMTTTFFADQCLNIGGIIAFHDAFMPSTAACVKYLIRERSYEIIALAPDSTIKRLLRTIKYGVLHGKWYGIHVVPNTTRSLVALRKTVSRGAAL